MFSGWEMAFGLGALALGITLAYGVYQTVHAGRGAERASQEGAKRLYDATGESEKSPDGAPRRGAPPLVWIMAGLLAAWLVTVFALQDRVHNTAGPTPESVDTTRP